MFANQGVYTKGRVIRFVNIFDCDSYTDIVILKNNKPKCVC